MSSPFRSSLPSLRGAIEIDVQKAETDAYRIAEAHEKAANRIDKAYDRVDSSLGSFGNPLKDRFNTFRTSLDQLKQTQADIINDAKPLTDISDIIEGAYGRLNGELTNTQKSLATISDGFGRIEHQMLAITAASAAFNAYGLKQADNLRLLNIQFSEMTGSAEEAATLMAKIQEGAENAGLPVRQLQRDFLGLVPSLEFIGGNIDEYINITARLASINPREGTSGAVFALREAIVSDFQDLRSLYERFNLPARQLRELTAETGSFAEALNVVLNAQGATNDALTEYTQSLAGLTVRLQDTIQRKLEAAFDPFLDTARAGLQDLVSIVESIPPELITLGASALGALGTLSAMGLAFRAIHETGRLAYEAITLISAGLKALTATQTVGSALARGGIGVAVGAAGVGLGIAGARAIGQATGNEELANSTLDDLIRNIGYVIGEFVRGVAELGYALARVLGGVINEFLNFGKRIEIIKLSLESAFQGMVSAIGDVLIAIGDALSGLGAGGLSDEGRRIKGDSEAFRQEADARIAQLTSEIDTTYDVMMDSIDAGWMEMQANIIRIFAPDIYSAFIDDTASSVNASTGLLEDAFAKMTEMIGAAGTRLAAAADDAIALQVELDELLSSGDPTGAQDRIEALDREKQAIEEQLRTLGPYIEYSKQAKLKYTELSERLSVINEQIPEFTRVLGILTDEALDANLEEYNAAIAKLSAERQAALDEEVANYEEKLAELDDTVADRREKLNEKELEAWDDYFEKEQEIREAHRKKLADIDRKFDQARRLAASELNAAGVAAAINAAKEATREANETRDEQQRANDKRITDQRENLSKEYADLAEYYTERRDKIQSAHDEELEEIRNKFAQEYITQRDAYLAEQELLVQARENALAILAQTYVDEDSIRQSGYNTLLQSAYDFVQKIGIAASNLAASSTGTFGSKIDKLPGFAPGPPKYRETPPTAPPKGIGKGVGIEKLEINVNGSDDPRRVAEEVNRQFVRLAEGL